MKAMGVIFSNIYDSSLGELTNYRTVASLPFGGRYRQIDFVLSNMSNSHIYNVGLITKYNYRSLMDHLGSCQEWDLNRKGEGLAFIPPFSSGNTAVYKGKLEALYSAVGFIDNENYDYVVLSDSTVLCNIDYRDAIRRHRKSGADVTVIACKESGKDIKKSPLVMQADRKYGVTEIMLDAIPNKGDFVGMGMFVFDRRVLVEVIKDSYSRGLVHLERDFIQKQFNQGNLRVAISEFDGVVLRNDSIESYFANSMELLNSKVRKGIFKTDNPIYTKVRDEVPTYYGEGSSVSECLIADGCNIYGQLEKSIIFRDVDILPGADVKSSIVMQGARIGKNVRLKYVILDKNVTVRDSAELIGTKEHPVIIKKGETV